MGFRFRKSINLGGGFKVNLSKSGVGYSWGTKGFRFTKTAKGTNRTTLSVPGTGMSYTTESRSKKSKPVSSTSVPSNKMHISNNANTDNGGSSMAWIDFIICLFFGILGVHKFKNRQIGMGLLYLFTGGLLGIGWLYDCVKYLMVALNTQSQVNPDPSATETFSGPELPPETSKLFVFLKKYGSWILTAFFALLALVFMPSFASFIAILAIAFVIPIPKWQSIISRYVHGTIKKIAVIVLAFFTLIAAPSGSSGAGNDDLSAIVPPATTVHAHDFQKATCSTPKTCSTCGETEGEPLAHQWSESTCLARKTCALCQVEEGELADHIWIDATCLDPKTCSVCNTVEGGTVDHTWIEANCLEPKTCSVCNATEGEITDHNWLDATCIAPKTCSHCKITDGDVTDHSWDDANCLAPMTCSVCKATEGDLGDHSWDDATCLAPMTCSVCKATEGDLGDHSWDDATCLAPMTCSVCNKTDGDRTAHSYYDGYCVVCDDKETTVWIPQSGSKYHRRSGCSNMSNPSEVPISTAKAWGYEPCKKCY